MKTKECAKKVPGLLAQAHVSILSGGPPGCCPECAVLTGAWR